MPGQLTIMGTRAPHSSMVALQPESCLPPLIVHCSLKGRAVPLSLVKTKTVFSRSFRRLTSAISLPTNAYQGNHSDQRHADVILTDIDMPSMNGIEFLNLLHLRNCPCQHIALMTGNPLNDSRLHKIERKGVKLFLKPFSIDAFLGWVSLIQRN